MTTEYVYSLSSEEEPNHMVKDAVRSIMSLKQWVDPGDVTVYFTPPRRERDVRTLEALGVNVVRKENETEPFSLNVFGEAVPFGEMWNLTYSDADTVVWLDNDTIVARDITEVVAGDFDFKARPEEDKRDDDEWYEMFDRYGKPPMDWRFNAGFLVFKNGIHAEIKDEWKEFMESDLGYYDAPTMQDAHGLALCVSEYTTAKMTKREHVMEWRDEPTANGYLYHYITGYDAKSQIQSAIRRRVPEPLKRRIRKWQSKRNDPPSL